MAEYEYYSDSEISPNTNTNIIRVFIMTEYEYEYYSDSEIWPNTNTNIIRVFIMTEYEYEYYSCFYNGRIRILFRLRNFTEYEYEYYSERHFWSNSNTNT